MRIEVADSAPGEVDADLLAAATFEGGLTGSAAELDDLLDGRLTRLLADGELTGKLGSAAVIHVDGGIAARRVAIAGLGAPDTAGPDAFRTAAAAADAIRARLRRNARLARRRVVRAPAGGPGPRRGGRCRARSVRARTLEDGRARAQTGRAARPARPRRARRPCRARLRRRAVDEPRARPRQQPSEPGDARPAGGARRGDRVRRPAPDVRGARAGGGGGARDGRVRGRRTGQPQRAADDRAPLRASGAHARGRHARPRRQGDHLRHGRHLAQAAAAHGGHEGRHGRRRRRARGDGRDRRAGPPRARYGRDRRRGEHARRKRVPPGRHPHRRQRQDDRDHEHRRRGPARARRRTVVRPARGRDPRRSTSRR